MLPGSTAIAGWEGNCLPAPRSEYHNCVEIASDATIDNELSQRAHEALGYQVVDRCVHYRKEL